MHDVIVEPVTVDDVSVDASIVDPPLTVVEVKVDPLIVEPSTSLSVNVEVATTEFEHFVLVQVFPVPGQSPATYEPVPNGDRIRKKKIAIVAHTFNNSYIPQIKLQQVTLVYILTYLKLDVCIFDFR